MRTLKNVSYVAFFAVVILLGDRLLSLSAKKIIQSSRNQFVRMYERRYPADILFLGDSRVDRDFNFRKISELTGKVCLNLGLGGNSALISEVLLKDYVQRYGVPKLVVIGLSQTTASPESMGEMRIFSYCSPNITSLAKRLDPTYAAFESVFTSLRFNDPAFWRLLTEVFREPAARLLKSTIPPEKKNRWMTGHRFERPILDKNMEALKRICEYSDSNKIRMALLISPSWSEYLKAISNYSLWVDALQKAVGQHVIHDYSGIFVDHPEYFNDEIHLNARGATRFVEILVADKVI